MTGVHASVDLVVGDADTAVSLCSGDVPVLATPRLITLCEQATVLALVDRLAPEETSVGCRVEVSHVAPVAVGTRVTATATLERCDGRRLVFSVSVTDRCGLGAAGRVSLIVVDRQRFLDGAR